jgi:hypothetical protein
MNCDVGGPSGISYALLQLRAGLDIGRDDEDRLARSLSSFVFLSESCEAIHRAANVAEDERLCARLHLDVNVSIREPDFDVFVSLDVHGDCSGSADAQQARGGVEVLIEKTSMHRLNPLQLARIEHWRDWFAFRHLPIVARGQYYLPGQKHPSCVARGRTKPRFLRGLSNAIDCALKEDQRGTSEITAERTVQITVATP